MPVLLGILSFSGFRIFEQERHLASADYNGQGVPDCDRGRCGGGVACRHRAAVGDRGSGWVDRGDLGGHPRAAAAPGGSCPGRVLVDVAVAIADGGETISDVQALADQPGLHGPVASTATIWRVLDGIDADILAGLRAARALARERAWVARGGVDRRRVAAGSGRGPGPELPGPGHRRHPGHRPLGEGGRGRHLQGRIRLSPDPGVPGQHQ